MPAKTDPGNLGAIHEPNLSRFIPLRELILESDSKLFECCHILTSMRMTRRMWAMSSHASALAMVFSQFFDIRRQRPSHANSLPRT